MGGRAGRVAGSIHINNIGVLNVAQKEILPTFLSDGLGYYKRLRLGSQ
jgi:hypothetical protein